MGQAGGVVNPLCSLCSKPSLQLVWMKISHVEWDLEPQAPRHRKTVAHHMVQLVRNECWTEAAGWILDTWTQRNRVDGSHRPDVDLAKMMLIWGELNIYVSHNLARGTIRTLGCGNQSAARWQHTGHTQAAHLHWFLTSDCTSGVTANKFDVLLLVLFFFHFSPNQFICNKITGSLLMSREGCGGWKDTKISMKDAVCPTWVWEHKKWPWY